MQPTGKIRGIDNIEALNRIRNDASADYQRRVPEATKGNISATLRSLMSYTPSYNEFCDALVNRIGTYILRDITWNNPLAIFKRGMLEFGDTIEEVQQGLIESYLYSGDRDYMEKDLFAARKPNVASQFHTVNRREYYKITVNRDQVRRAFLDESGLQQYLQQILAVPTTSDQWDEFLQTTSLFAEYEANGGFWHAKVPNLRTLAATEADSKAFIKKTQALAGNLQFISRKYNAAHMETFAKPEDLVLVTTPEVMANIGVEAWSAAFNQEFSQLNGRIVTIPEEYFGMEKTQAILTTKDFFVIADNLLENQSQPNAISLGTNYFLHHWEVISASLFVPAVALWTGDDDSAITIKPSELKLTIDKAAHADTGAPVSTTAKALPGENIEIVHKVAGKNTYDYEFGVAFSVTGAKSQRTRITNEGVLKVGLDETADTLTVVGSITYIDPTTHKRITQTPVTVQVSVDASKAVKVWPKE